MKPRIIDVVGMHPADAIITVENEPPRTAWRRAWRLARLAANDSADRREVVQMWMFGKAMGAMGIMRGAS